MTDLEKSKLLAAVKNYLRITWSDEDSDISEMIERGIAFFNSRGIVEVNFVEHKYAQQLLLDRCRYVRNYKAEEFEENFMSDILNLQLSLVLSEGDADAT